MVIEIKITQGELDEMGFSVDSLTEIIYESDMYALLVGFDVKVIVADE